LIYTGLRKSELASITFGQVFLDTKIPHIVLEAKHEKNRRGSTLPLHPVLVKELRKWLKQRGEILPQDK
jgi:integrase